MKAVPSSRIRVLREASTSRGRDHVLYWSSAYRRSAWNFALDRAVEIARESGKPLIVLDALRCGYRWASDRLHAFALQSIADRARACDAAGVAHYAYVEPRAGDARGLLRALAERAVAVVGDDFPCFFHPRMHAAAARKLDTRLEVVDSNGLLPMRATDTVFPTAHAFRRFLQRELAPHLAVAPSKDALARAATLGVAPIPDEILRRWPRAESEMLAADPEHLARLEIDHRVPQVETRGGEVAAAACLREFLRKKLVDYEEKRSEPEANVASGLSPYLHFGAISIHEVLDAVARREDWSPARVSKSASGSRAGWWGMHSSAEAFLDEAVTWRELGFNFCSKRDDFDRYESLPEFARRTLEAHASDPRPKRYDRATLEAARTHDPLWNAAQRELLRTGRMHNYLRMLWGKKILEWSATPREALDTLIELNNRYALDGRNPNSYSGIFWCLGRYDRAWGPERPIYGTVRYMTSENTARKFDVDGYLERFGPGPARRERGLFEA